MPDLSSDQVKTMQIVRHFWQPGGALASNPLYLLGTDDAQIGYITGGSKPNEGSVEPIWSPTPEQPRQFTLRGRTRSAPDLPTWDVEFTEYHGYIPRQLTTLRCPITFYDVSGPCESLSDIDRGWVGYLFIRADGIAGPTDMGARSGGQDDTVLMDSVSFTGARAYPAGQLAFGEEAATVVVQEVIDGAYLKAANCGDCGLVNDGTRFSYYVTRSNVGSPSAPGQIVYSLDAGQTWNTATIASIGVTNAPTALDIAGRRLFVLVPGGSQIFHATLNVDTGAPGSFTAVAAGAAYQDAWVKSPNDIWFAGSAGAIGRTRDIGVAPTLIDSGAGAVILSRIHGAGQTIVAVGATGTLRASRNGGASWSTIAVVVAGATITAGLTSVFCITPKRWWITTDAGRAYWTENSGVTWTESAFADSGAGACRDIVFVTPEVGYILHDASSVASCYCTVNGGRTWAKDGARLTNWPTFQRGNRAVVPTAGSDDVNANTLGIAGLFGVGGDGVIQLGVAPVV